MGEKEKFSLINIKLLQALIMQNQSKSSLKWHFFFNVTLKLKEIKTIIIRYIKIFLCLYNNE